MNFLLFMGLASSDDSVGPDYWILQSLISVLNNGLVSDNYASGIIPSSCSPIWIFMPLTVNDWHSASLWLFFVFTIHQRSELWGGRKWSGPRLRHPYPDWDPDLVTLSAPSSRSEGQLNEATGYFNQGEYSNLITIGTGSWSRVVKFCQLWTTHSHKN